MSRLTKTDFPQPLSPTIATGKSFVRAGPFSAEIYLFSVATRRTAIEGDELPLRRALEELLVHGPFHPIPRLDFSLL